MVAVVSTDVAPPPYRAARVRARAERRDRAFARVRVDIAPAVEPVPRRSRGIPFWVTASFAAHIGLAALGFLTPSSSREDRSFEQAVEMLEAPKPPPPVTAAAAEPPPPSDPVIAPPMKMKTPTPVPLQNKDEPPPDPIQAPAPSPDPPKPTRRVIGLNLDSTVAGNGPSFAVGNTRMGETSRTAGDPAAAAPLPGAQFVPPRRIREVEPNYPPALRAQSVEGEVGLKVDVDATGRVSNVTVVQARVAACVQRGRRRSRQSERLFAGAHERHSCRQHDPVHGPLSAEALSDP